LRDCKIDEVIVKAKPEQSHSNFKRTNLRRNQMAKKNQRPAAARMATPAAPVEFAPDYTNVKKDLKRIGILAGTFFAVLIVLSFFIK